VECKLSQSRQNEAISDDQDNQRHFRAIILAHLPQKLSLILAFLNLLDSKPYVLDLLQEILLDSRFWLIIKPLSSIERLEIYQESNISLAKQYWFDVLFPTWWKNGKRH
jgi:hypothetical protein